MEPVIREYLTGVVEVEVQRHDLTRLHIFSSRREFQEVVEAGRTWLDTHRPGEGGVGVEGSREEGSPVNLDGVVQEIGDRIARLAKVIGVNPHLIVNKVMEAVTMRPVG